MSTGLDTSAEAETQAATILGGAVWLETPVLRFVDVAEGGSKVQAIVFRGFGYSHLEMVVVIPPLAPFSVTQSPRSPFFGRRSDDAGLSPTSVTGTTPTEAALDEISAELWIRYDATSSMASDVGQVTVVHADSGRQWTVELDGSGPLAKPTF
ncbi:MAG: hypothetical protein ACRBK7_00650 [Acidimicrobiales bacterium]